MDTAAPWYRPVGPEEAVFSHAYASPPPELARDADELKRVHGR